VHAGGDLRAEDLVPAVDALELEARVVGQVEGAAEGVGELRVWGEVFLDRGLLDGRGCAAEV